MWAHTWQAWGKSNSPELPATPQDDRVLRSITPKTLLKPEAFWKFLLSLPTQTHCAVFTGSVLLSTDIMVQPGYIAQAGLELMTLP